MTILINSDRRVVVQLESGAPEGALPMRLPYDASNIVGVVPIDQGPSAGAWRPLIESAPRFASVRDAVVEAAANVSVIVASPERAADAILEAIAADMPLIVAACGDLPGEKRDLIQRRLEGSRSTIIVESPARIGHAMKTALAARDDVAERAVDFTSVMRLVEKECYASL
jgi:succinyl-CoA synthetase alpha subunit